MSYCKIEGDRVVGLDMEKINERQKEIDNLVKQKFALKEIRKQKHLSRRELAEKSGVNEQTIRFLEEEINDPTNAKLSTLVKIASALHCKVRDLYPCEKNI